MTAVVFVTNKQWDMALRRIERANLKAHGRSLSWVSMSNNARGLIVEIQSDRGGRLVKDSWRDELKRQFIVQEQGNGNQVND